MLACIPLEVGGVGDGDDSVEPLQSAGRTQECFSVLVWSDSGNEAHLGSTIATAVSCWCDEPPMQYRRAPWGGAVANRTAETVPDARKKLNGSLTKTSSYNKVSARLRNF